MQKLHIFFKNKNNIIWSWAFFPWDQKYVWTPQNSREKTIDQQYSCSLGRVHIFHTATILCWYDFLRYCYHMLLFDPFNKKKWHKNSGNQIQRPATQKHQSRNTFPCSIPIDYFHIILIPGHGFSRGCHRFVIVEWFYLLRSHSNISWQKLK